MPSKVFDINLDLVNSDYQLVDMKGKEIVSGDTDSNKFNINLFQNFVPVNTTGNTAVIVFKKPDGTTVFQNLTVVDATKGKYTCTLSSQTIAVPGTVKAEVSLYEGTKRLTSTRFQFIVRKAILNEDTVESSNEFSALTQALSTVNQYDNRITSVEDTLGSHLADYASFVTNNAVAHNSIYRGKYLGSAVTPEQYTAISSGTFTDLYIGDYWTIGGIKYRIAAFDYYYNTGDTACTKHHAVIIPDTQLYTHVMNDTNITTGGYTGSKMYTEGLTQAKTTINTVFSGHVVTHRQILSNATVDGKASGWAWVDSEVELMNEIMVYGSSVFGAGSLSGGTGHNIGVDKSQLPLFALNPRMINTRQSYWLRDVVSVSYFAYVGNGGNASCVVASYALGVRPAFSIS